MISFITGAIKSVNKNSLTVLTSGGVGYDIFIPTVKVGNCRIGQEISLLTYLKVGENTMDLYGFEEAEEKDFFTLLMTVSGIGPKSAMNILNLGSIDNIKSAIARKDVKYLTDVQGLGKKTAERLIVELQSKVNSLGKGSKIENGESQILADVIDVLVSMGYAKDEAKNVVMDLDTKNKNTQQVLKEALRKLGK